MKVSAVLITKEKAYPAAVLASLPAFDEILIETECSSVLRRYQLAKQAKNEIIYVQDDDCIAPIDKLFSQYNGQITNAMTPGHFAWYQGTGITLIGWGAFFPKKMLDFSRYTKRYGIDELLLSQADRVFTYLYQPHNSFILDIINLASATDTSRMSTQPDHWRKLEIIKQRLSAL